MNLVVQQKKLLGGWLAAVLLLCAPQVQAATYANVSVPFNWIDASAHTKLGPSTGGVYSPTYKFLGRAETSGTYRCGTSLPFIDDAISDNIPIGFTFVYAGVPFTNVRIMSNGRLQFNNNLTCYYGSPVTQLPYPNANLNYTMRVYGGDLDPSLQSEISGYSTPCTDRNTCYVSYATLGAAPYRQFVVTWSNVPEWTTDSSATGNYNLQVILQENGEFIYQYGSMTPGPGATIGQVGWQADSGDYDVPAVGYPATNSAIKFYIPQPVAEYRMEQPSWNGTAGEVLDTSGNGRHATAIVTGATTRPQDVAGGKVCRGGQFAHNTTTAAISAIDTNIAVPTTVGSSGTISFWYNNSANSPNATRLLFDATTTKKRFFYLQRTNNRALSFRVTDSGNTDRTATTADNVLPTTGWSHIVVSWNFNNLAGSNQDRLRIWVDGVLRQTSAFTTTNVISPQIGTLYIGDNRSNKSPIGTSAGSPGGTTATLDEFRIYNFEGGLALVQRDMNQTGACLDHYAISHAGSGQACQSNNVTIRAHNKTHGLITMPNNTTQITLSTSTGEGDWSLVNGYGTLNNGTANDGIATYLWNGEYQAVFALTHSTPGTVNFNATDGQIVESPAEDPALSLAACFTNFNACHDYGTSHCSAATGKLYTRLAGVGSDYDIVALDGADNVATSFTGKAVVSLIARANAGAVDAQNCFTTAPDYTQVLDNAVTSFTAGRLTLTNKNVPEAYREARIKVVCDSTNCPPAGMTWCSTDNFAIRPLSFTVTSSNANADSTGTSATNEPKIKAGEVFGLKATAVPGYNGTPKIDNGEVEAHSGATTAGSVSGSFGAAKPATGEATGAAFTYDEVGYFRLKPHGVYDDDFTAVDQPDDCTNDFSNTLTGEKFGCKFGNTAYTDYFGRFIPDHFDTTVTNACVAGGFTYSAQPFPLTLTARNQGGATTTNYSGAFAKDVTLSDANGADGTFNPASVAAGDFTGGVATPSVSFTFSNKLTAPSTLKVRGTDNEASSADGTEGTTPIRSGRLVLSNAYGSELLPLNLPLRLEYYSGTGWQPNTLDTCTELKAENVALAFPVASANHLAACETAVSLTGSAPNYALSLSAPGVGNTGWSDATLNLGATASGQTCLTVGGAPSAATTANTPWLQYPAASNPQARATFGVYKDRNEFIYQREVY